MSDERNEGFSNTYAKNNKQIPHKQSYPADDRGGLTITNNKNCCDRKEVYKECQRAKRAQDPEKAREKDRAYYAANAEKKRAQKRKYREANREKVREAQRRCDLKHKEKRKQMRKNYYAANAEWLKEEARKRHHANKDYRNAKRREWTAANKERVQAYREEHKEHRAARVREQRKTDSVARITHCLRNRTIRAFQQKGYKKSSKTSDLLGCDWGFLKSHMENQFLPGMTWENQGEWEIDHIIPLAAAKSESDVEVLCRWENLRPLWAEDNLRKNDKIPPLADVPSRLIAILPAGLTERIGLLRDEVPEEFISARNL